MFGRWFLPMAAALAAVSLFGTAWFSIQAVTLAAEDQSDPFGDGNAAKDTVTKPTAPGPIDPFGGGGDPFAEPPPGGWAASPATPASKADKNPKSNPFQGNVDWPPVDRPSVKLSSRPLRSGREAIEAALAEPTQLEFIETPLQDVIDYLSDLHGINIIIDRLALDNAGIAPDTAVTINLSGVKLCRALDLMLRPLHLTWTLRHDVLLITTPEEEQIALSTEVYDVADLVTCRDAQGDSWEDYDTLVNAIVATVACRSWDPVGGSAAIRGATFGSAKVLIVTQTYSGQTQVVGLLEKLRDVARKNGDEQQPPQRDRPAADEYRSGGLAGRPSSGNGSQRRSED